MRPLRDINIKVAITVNLYQILTSELWIEGTGNNFRGQKSPRAVTLAAERIKRNKIG